MLVVFSTPSEEEPIDWSRVDNDVISDLDAALNENQLFQVGATLPDNDMWAGFAHGCGPSAQDIRAIASLVNLRAGIIPVVFDGYYGTHRHLAQAFEGKYLEIAHYVFFDRPDLVQQYQPAAVVFDFYRQQIDEIPDRDAVLAKTASTIASYVIINRNVTLDGEVVFYEDEHGAQLGPLSVALLALDLEPYPNSCLTMRNDNLRLSLEDWIISFWMRRSLEDNYDVASQLISELANRSTEAVHQ